MLLEMMLAMTLGLLAIALSIGGVHYFHERLAQSQQQLEREQDAHYALQQMGRDLRMAGRFGCASVPLSAEEGAPQGAQLLQLRFGRQALAITRLAVDHAGHLSELRLRAPTEAEWRDWRELVLASCLQRHELRLSAPGASLQHHPEGLRLQLAAPQAPPVAIDAAQPGQHLPSLGVWLPAAHRYFLSGAGDGRQLWRSRQLAGAEAEPPALLLEGVRAFSIRYGVWRGCGTAASELVELPAAALQGDDWKHLRSARLELTLQIREGGQPWTQSLSVALNPVQPCLSASL
ncbi:hypothetical protein CEK28_17145 [Xenophilus sp. AP218F]|nr:hypothetical protein CEK28_17145 [Xenophilus sp. AP218F]